MLLCLAFWYLYRNFPEERAVFQVKGKPFICICGWSRPVIMSEALVEI